LNDRVSRRRFLTLASAGVATAMGSVALYGVQRMATSGGSAEASAAARPATPQTTPQRVIVETRYTPAGVPYPVAIALD
jgi:hypothetical protein